MGAFGFECLQRGRDRFAATLVQPFVEVLADDSDLQAFHRLRQAGNVVRHRVIDRRRIARIGTRHHAKQHRRILCRTGDDTGLVEAGRESNHAVTGNATVSRFDARRSGQRGGLPNRAAGIRTRPGRHQASRNRGSAAAR